MDMSLPPDAFRHGSVSNKVYDLLRDAIIQLKLRPGNPLSETELARQLKVSRQPVREAFIKLAEAGLVEVRPQRGTYVLLISRRDVDNARFIREAIEVAFVRKAAAEASDALVDELKQLILRQAAARDRSDHVAFLELDEEFHQAIARGAGCETAWKLLETLKAQMDRVRFLSFAEATPIDTLIGQHEAIASAIAARDPERAEAAMRVHLGELLKSLPKLAEAHPDLFTA
ncbi:MAG TPA: GntR family transcriptional regulator [Amaricoccus sp.]|uniref:GntR family transcriptional regulator n=1 Tax=Amaricoccus sp. TaxID=1872485 RepID=UPI002C435472|nr:GntR family transcriptional regulator [Amaricoccus sp.]HMQ93295.1 GntR family transcriptional regulator [Amaricoccus sp.]HMR53262.1 GntR family transcriptional regulator [Amaricoccus sp.]HMR59665.1 GntR family transcriptional regulator [Amaricoccus sp.]HMU00192.1 GntR family transcriptional regulator [Amaricoccus sp.]